MKKTAAISFGAVLALLAIYVVIFLNRVYLTAALPPEWVGHFEPIFQPAEVVQQRFDRHRVAKQWRGHEGIWSATYPEDFHATFEIIESETGRFQIRSDDQIDFVDDKGSDLLLDLGGGALFVTQTHSTEIFPPDDFIFMRVFTLPLDGRPPVEYGLERPGDNRSEQDAGHQDQTRIESKSL